MGRGSIRPLVDKLLDGQLAALLEAWRTEGLSYNDMAYRLRSEHDINVSQETIRRWCDPDAVLS